MLLHISKFCCTFQNFDVHCKNFDLLSKIFDDVVNEEEMMGVCKNCLLLRLDKKRFIVPINATLVPLKTEHTTF